MFMLTEAEPHPETGEVCAVLKATKGRDGLDMPKAGRTFVWRGLPSGKKIPLDTPVPLSLEHVKDNISGQDLGKCRTAEKLDRWKRAETAIRASGGTYKITDLAKSLDVGERTIRGWIGADLSPFKSTGTGLIGMNR